MTNKLNNAIDLSCAKDNIYTCLNGIIRGVVFQDKASEAAVEELLDETIKYLGFIQRRLDEISGKTDVDKGDTSL